MDLTQIFSNAEFVMPSLLFSCNEKTMVFTLIIPQISQIYFSCNERTVFVFSLKVCDDFIAIVLQ